MSGHTYIYTHTTTTLCACAPWLNIISYKYVVISRAIAVNSSVARGDIHWNLWLWLECICLVSGCC